MVVQRRGNLNQYAIVLCRTEHGNATSLIGSSFARGKLDYTEHSGQVREKTKQSCLLQILPIFDCELDIFQVQFDVYETEKVCSIQINDDSVFEGRESFTVELSMPTYSLLGMHFFFLLFSFSCSINIKYSGNITKTTVYINDDHDIPTIQFLGTQFTEEESDAVIHVPIKRTGKRFLNCYVVCDFL